MDLAELKFVVDTKQLEDAATKIEALGVAVAKVNKPVTKAALESEKLALAQAKVAAAAAKAETAQLKLEQAQAQVSNTTGKSVSVLERQNLILQYMSKGLSKGQSSYVATAVTAGALDTEITKLITTLKDQRSLMGGDPFDKSIGLMQKLNNETKIATEVNNLFSRGLNLTEKQMIDIAREHERLNTLYRLEGKSLNGLAAEYDQIIQKSVAINQANDARTLSMKAQIKAQNDTAKANEYMSKELERVNRLTESGGNVTSATNNKIIKFEQALKASGATAAQQVTKLEAYRQKLLSIQKAGGDRQVDYLSRALGPQITDIAVGLATGQAPLTILLQQGGQLRDQFALAGVAGSQMGDMLVKATSSMVTSVKDVGVAIGSAFIGAINNSGKAITKFAMDITGANNVLENMRYQIALFEKGSSGPIMKTFLALGSTITFLTGVILAGAVAALVAFGVALNAVIKEENALNRALNLTGGAMGLSMDMAYDAARGMEQFGVSTGTALEVLTEMSKAGGMSADTLKLISTTAQAMKTAFDIPIADTVKKFKELQEKPTQSLTKLAVQLGTIPVEILKQVDAYERAGNSIKAAQLATDTYAKAGKEAAARVVEDFGTITRLGISLGNIWDKTWESIMGIGRKGTLSDQIAAIRESLPNLRAQVSPDADVNDANAQALELAESQLRALLGQAAAEKNLAVEKKANAEAAKTFEDDKKKRDEAANKIKAEAKRLEQSYISELEKARETYISQSGALDHLTKSEIALNKVRSSPEFSKYTEDQRKNIELLYVAASAVEKSIKVRKDNTDALEKFAQAQKKSDDALFDSLDVQHQLNMQVLEQNDLLALEGSLIGATDAQRKKALGTKKLDLQLEKEIAAIKKRSISAGEQESQIASARQRRLDAEKNLNTEIANDFGTEMKKQYNIISNGLTDAAITGLFEGGKAGSKKLRDLLVAELKKPITVVVKAVVDNLFGDLINSATGGKSGSVSPGSNILSTLKSGYDLLTNGVSASIATSFGKLASTSFGQSIGLTTQVSGPVSASGQAATQFTPMGQNISAGLGMAGNALAGYGIQKAISGGYKTGESGIVDAITVAASAYFGPIAGVVAGVFNRAFGRKLADSGVKGSFGGAEGFQGENFTFEKGGYFRSDRERGSAIDPRTQSAFSMQFKSLQVQNALMADSLGLSTEAIATFTKDIRLSFKDLTEEQIAEKIQAEFTAINESLAELALGTTQYTKNGETAAQALTRLSTSLLTANQAIKHWGVTLYDISLAGADAASAFVDLFGGIEGFSKAMGFFYDNFFSDTEKMENLTTDLTTAFGKLGEELPNTREAFRALVTAAKEAGDDQQVKNLLDLQYAFAELVPVTEEVVGAVDVLTETMKGLLKERANLEIELLQVQGRAEEANAALRRIATEGFTDAEIAAYDYNEALKLQIQSYKDSADLVKSNTDDAYAALQRSVNAEKTRLDSEISAVRIRETLTRESIASINSLFEVLDNNIKSLYSEVSSTGAMQLGAARSFITQSLSTARITGYLPDSEQLSDAIYTVRTQLQKNQYKSKVDSERDRLLLALELEALQEITDVQLSVEEKILASIEDQLQSLDDQKIVLDDTLTNAREQIDILRGINTSVLSVKDALLNLGTARTSETAARISESASQQSSAASAYAASLGSAYDARSATPVSSREQEIADIYNTVLGRSADVTGLQYWAKSALSSEEIKAAVAISGEAQLRAISVEAQNQWIQEVNKQLMIPTDIVARANGGYTPSGMTLVGEEGPELVNFNRPGMVYTAAQSAALMGGSSEELAAIRQELVMLRAETRAVVSNTSKAAKILDRSSPDGQSLQVTVLTA